MTDYMCLTNIVYQYSTSVFVRCLQFHDRIS